MSEHRGRLFPLTRWFALFRVRHLVEHHGVFIGYAREQDRGFLRTLHSLKHRDTHNENKEPG